MKTAAYTSVQTSNGGTGKYPLSTQTLDFIQSQILLLQKLSRIVGGRYILQQPDGSSCGAAVIDGEVFAIKANPVYTEGNTKYINVETKTSDIEADGETYQEARTVRTAYYSDEAVGDESYPVSEFTDFSESGLLDQVGERLTNLEKEMSYVLDEKLSVCTAKNVTQNALDVQTSPIIINCKDSLKLFGSCDYSLAVTLIGDNLVHQQIALPDGRRYVRTYERQYENNYYTEWEWSEWGRVGDDLHLEVKIVGGAVYLRHGYLPTGTSIVLLRKKTRSRFRRTGDTLEYRLPKRQYVHYKGIALSQSSAGKWYVPTCISTGDDEEYGDLKGKTLSELCEPMIYAAVSAKSGISGYRVQGVRKTIVIGSGSYNDTQHKGYVPLALQVTRLNNGKEVGGEMVRLKYRISYQKIRHTSGALTYAWNRTFSVD